MSQTDPTPRGLVASLHLHPAVPGAVLQSVSEVELVQAKGVRHDQRYFEKISRQTGKPTRRQVTLIEREQIADHAAALGLKHIPPNTEHTKEETTGIDLVSLIGSEIV